jgi:hypothetical protein
MRNKFNKHLTADLSNKWLPKKIREPGKKSKSSPKRSGISCIEWSGSKFFSASLGY